MTIQSAAIPYRIDEQGVVYVLLVTSRTRKRWILPKGKIGDRLMPSRSAEREAFEEAGVLGRIAKQPIGSYFQTANMDQGSDGIVVQAYTLHVTDVLPVWREMDQRDRRWFKLSAALKNVRDPEIRRVLREFERTTVRGSWAGS